MFSTIKKTKYTQWREPLLCVFECVRPVVHKIFLIFFSCGEYNPTVVGMLRIPGVADVGDFPIYINIQN